MFKISQLSIAQKFIIIIIMATIIISPHQLHSA